jgi:DNA-binding beta-propeller fold protein YncE
MKAPVLCVVSLVVGAFFPLAAAEPPNVAFNFVLSDFSGPVRVGEARVVVDGAHGEVYVAQERDVHVFNEFGMEVYRFHTDLQLGPIRDLAVLPDGSLLVLLYDYAQPETPVPLLCTLDFRGRRLGAVTLSGLPEGMAEFRPNRLFLHGDRLLLLSTTHLLAAWVSLDGQVQEILDLGKALEIPDDARADHEISGAGLDGNGNLALTMAVLFRAFLISPDGKVLASWGKSGSAAGAFGNIGGIGVDAQGRVYVVDRIRKVVMIFDADATHTFLREFGGDPRELGMLVMPSDVVIDAKGRAYVTQVGSGGVSVFHIQ